MHGRLVDPSLKGPLNPKPLNPSSHAHLVVGSQQPGLQFAGGRVALLALAAHNVLRCAQPAHDSRQLPLSACGMPTLLFSKRCALRNVGAEVGMTVMRRSCCLCVGKHTPRDQRLHVCDGVPVVPLDVYALPRACCWSTNGTAGKAPWMQQQVDPGGTCLHVTALPQQVALNWLQGRAWPVLSSPCSAMRSSCSSHRVPDDSAGLSLPPLLRLLERPGCHAQTPLPLSQGLGSYQHRPHRDCLLAPPAAAREASSASVCRSFITLSTSWHSCSVGGRSPPASPHARSGQLAHMIRPLPREHRALADSSTLGLSHERCGPGLLKHQVLAKQHLLNLYTLILSEQSCKCR